MSFWAFVKIILAMSVLKKEVAGEFFPFKKLLNDAIVLAI